MSDFDSFSPHARAQEDDYFRKKDRELIEKLKQQTTEKDRREGLRRSIDIDDPEVLKALEELGFTGETVALLPLVPVIEVAWAEGGVTKAERDLIVRLAHSRGVVEGDPRWQQLTAWLDTRPSDAVFTGARRLIRAMIDTGATQTAKMNEADIVKYCEEIAAASGGVFGIGKVSAEERALLSNIAADLQARRR